MHVSQTLWCIHLRVQRPMWGSWAPRLRPPSGHGSPLPIYVEITFLFCLKLLLRVVMNCQLVLLSPFYLYQVGYVMMAFVSLYRMSVSGGARIFRLPGTARAPEFRLGHVQKIMRSFLTSSRSEASSYTVRTNGSTHGTKNSFFCEKMVVHNYRKPC